ncbi:MAG TPA: hypothetical protein VIO59_09295 [Rhodanobacter sp.]
MAADDDRSTLPARRALLRKSLGRIPVVTLVGAGIHPAARRQRQEPMPS